MFLLLFILFLLIFCVVVAVDGEDDVVFAVVDIVSMSIMLLLL